MPVGVTQAQLHATNALITGVVGSVATITAFQETLASKDFVAGAVASSEQSMRLEMKENLAELKALVKGISTSGTTSGTATDAKVDAIAKAAVLGTVGNIEASLDAFNSIYGDGWADEVIGSMPTSVEEQ